MYKKIKTLTILAVLVILLSACGEAEVKKVDSEGGSSNSEGGEEKAPEFYKVDETISVDGLEISINSVSWGKANQYVEPTNGKVLRIEITAKNNSDDNALIDNIDFDLSDSEGTMLEFYFANDDANMFTTEIKTGKQAKGILEYDVSESESFELYYEPSFSFKSNAEVKWLINKEDIK